MAYKVIILYQLYMPSYFLGTFTEYPSSNGRANRQRKEKEKISFPCSDNGSLRCSCSGTIGALASVVLLFLNDRPVVSERSEFRRSVKEKAR